MNNEDFQTLARQGALDALKALAAIAVDPTAAASDREHARRMVELRLDQASNDIPPDFRREIENAIRVFEPRLSNVTVSLDRPTKAAGQPKPAEGALRYHVRALLRIEPEPEPVLFDAVLEPVSGRVAVELAPQKRTVPNAG